MSSAEYSKQTASLDGTWGGTWKSNKYPPNIAYGSISLTVKSSLIAFTFIYKGTYKTGQSISHIGSFNPYEDFPSFCFKEEGQDFSFVLKEKTRMKISGEYKTTYPFDEGTFLLIN